MSLHTWRNIAILADLVCAVILTAIILVQSGKSAGLSGAIAGSSDSFMSRGGSKTRDAKLAQCTKWVGLAFVMLSLITVILVNTDAAKAIG
ncbi:MAG: preprotein translocase subunit SecG [Oscillospiraceae bacterium]|nr:preprotein translocase subunit SecG [Oscillospiraceae bacterium]